MGREGAVFGNADEEQRRGVRVELQTGYCTVWTCRRENEAKSEKTTRKQRGNKGETKGKQREDKGETKGRQRESVPDYSAQAELLGMRVAKDRH